MGQPITWRNVTGPSPAEASRPLEAAGQSFGNAFEGLNNVIRNTEAFNANQVLRLDEAAKQSYLDRLAQAKTPEELAALQPELDKMRQGLSVAARAKVLGADEARLTSVRQGVTAAQAFNDSRQDRESLPMRNNLVDLLTAGRFSEARESLDSSVDIRDKAPMFNAIAQAEAQARTRGFEEAKRTQEQALYPGEVTKQAASIEALRAQVTASNAQAEHARAGVKGADVAAERLRLDGVEAARKRFVDNSPLAYGSLDSKTGMDALGQYLQDNKITGDAHDDIRQQLNKFFPNGKMVIKDKSGIEMEVGVPVKTVLQAIGASEDNFLSKAVPFWSRRGDDMHNRLKELLSSGSLQKDLADTLEVLNMSPTRGLEKNLKK